jgi:hypothetical protein
VNHKHKQLAMGRWAGMPLIEQMANIGSEFERAQNWRRKNNEDYAQKAFDRSLELISLTIENIAVNTHLKEMTRLREILIDFFLGANEYASTESALRKYFMQFAHACRKHN